MRKTKNISSQDGPVSAAMSNLRVLIAAGGTGGHVYPAIAIADALVEKQPTIQNLFVGTRDHMEWKAVPRAGYDIKSIWISGFHRRFTLKNLLFPLKLTTSLIQSLNIIRRFKPHIVISCGGYVAGPVGFVASKLNIPVVLQEQNSFPGVTNRLLGKKASKIFIAFQDAERYFPSEKVQLVGNPTRKSLTGVNSADAYADFGLNPRKQTLLVLGGSGGARSINEAMQKNIDALHDQLDLQIIWQCGSRYFDRLKREVEPQNYDNLILKDFLYNMPEAYAVADLVISRAGALSCSELALTGKPSILVPSPNVAGDHQTKNARSMVDEGAAIMAKDKSLDEQLFKLVKQTIKDQRKLEQMRQASKKLAKPRAAEVIANEILTLIETQ